METHFWFDIEGTMLDAWRRPDFLPRHAACLRRAIQEQEPDSVNIFSFAVWDAEHRKHFRTSWQKSLEDFFGVTFKVIPTVEDFQKALGRITGQGQLSRDVVRHEWGKWRTFETVVLDPKVSIYRNGCAKDVRCVLFDDDVMDLSLTDRRRNIIVESVNINDLVQDSQQWLRDNS